MTYVQKLHFISLSLNMSFIAFLYYPVFIKSNTFLRNLSAYFRKTLQLRTFMRTMQ